MDSTVFSNIKMLNMVVSSQGFLPHKSFAVQRSGTIGFYSTKHGKRVGISLDAEFET